MIIIKNNGIAIQDTFSLETINYIFYWKGLLFIKGFLSGEESIKELDRLLVKVSIEEAASHLYGQFICFIYAKNTAEFYAFTDNSGLGYLVYNKSAISSSFLELIKKTEKQNLSLNLENVVEFILTGFVYRHETIFDHINLLKPTEIINCPSMLIREKVNVIHQVKDVKSNFINFFIEISKSIKNNKISIDLTGGTDSTTITTLLKYVGLSFETACAIPGSLDVVSAQKKADLLGIEFVLCNQKINEQTLDQELQDVFVWADGINDILLYHRLWQLDMARKKREITLTIGGAAGELYKDALYWRTAFFSGTTENFIKKMAMSGIANFGGEGRILPYFLFSEKAKEIIERHKNKTYQYLLSKYGNRDKFLAAHLMFREYTVQPPRPKQGGVPAYLVLLENELVQIGLKIPEWERILHLFYRNIITPINKDVARIPVNRMFGMNMSNRIGDILKDALQYLFFPAYKFFKKTQVQETIYEYVRKLQRTNENLELLKSRNIINRKLDVKNIPSTYLGRCYTIAEVLRVLDVNN